MKGFLVGRGGEEVEAGKGNKTGRQVPWAGRGRETKGGRLLHVGWERHAEERKGDMDERT